MDLDKKIIHTQIQILLDQRLPQHERARSEQVWQQNTDLLFLHTCKAVLYHKIGLGKNFLSKSDIGHRFVPTPELFVPIGILLYWS